MRPTPELLRHLTGEVFHNGLPVRWEGEPEDRLYRTRADLLVELVRGRRVVHVGCADHDAMTDLKRGRGKWLHQRLVDSAARCFGVDINCEGIERMRRDYGYEDVACLDILADDDPRLFGETWDDLLVPEVLEHIGNPVAFLDRARQRFAGRARRLVITVPNALDRGNHAHARRNVEVINSDHCHWYTPYTLAKVVIQAGFRPERLLLCRNGRIKPWSVWRNAYLARHPLLRNNIILIAGW